MRSKSHPDIEWLVGVGRAGNQPVADNVARSELAKPIEVEIRSEANSHIMEGFSESGGQRTTTASQRLSERLVARTNISLEGVAIAERWHDQAEGSYYALAVLNRREAIAGYGEKATALAEAANEFIRAAGEKETQGDLAGALSNYRRALDRATQFGVATARIRVIGKRMYAGPSPSMSVVQIETAFAKLAERMRIGVLIYQHLPTGTALPDGMSEAGILKALGFEGLTAAAMDDRIRSVGYAGLTADLSRTRDALAGRAEYLIIGKIDVVFQGEVKQFARPVYGYQSGGEGFMIDLREGRILGSVSFPADERTRVLGIDHGSAARQSLEKASPVLVGEVIGAVSEQLLGGAR